MRRGWIAFAAISGAISVIAGAFAAHGLDAQTKAREIGWLRTGSRYEAQHAILILIVVLLARSGHLGEKSATVALWLLAIGGVLFPAALYGLALQGPLWLGAVAPLGGGAFILGWLTIAGGALMRRGT